MSFSGFLDGQAGVGRDLSVGPATGLGETVGAAFDFTWKTQTTAAAIQYQGAPLNQRNDMIKQKFGDDIFGITKVRDKYPNPSAEGRLAMLNEANTLIDDWIAKGRQEAPDKYTGIKTTKEIKDEARKTVGLSENHLNEIMVRNPSSVSRAMGGFIGGAAATMVDPPNLVTLPLGASEIQGGLKGWNAARAVLKAAAVDGVINAGVEAVNQPAIMAWQKDLGRRYGFGDAAENVALAFAGGAGLSGLIRGLGRGLNYAGSVSMDALDRIASSEKLPASVRTAASFMSRQAHIDESAPPGMIKTGEDLKLHRETAQKIVDEFEHYEAPSVVRQQNIEAPVSEPAKSPNNSPAVETKTTKIPQVKALPKPEYLNTPDMPTKSVLQSNGRTEDVPLEMARSTQSKMYWKDFNAGKHEGPLIEGYEDMPVAARLENGEYLIFDGHHRAVLAMNDGKKTMPMHVVDVKKYDPANAGRKAAKSKNTETDELMSELRSVDKMSDVAPAERIQELDLPEGMTPEASADRVAIAENDLKTLVDDLGDETVSLEDGRVVSIKDFAKEVDGKKKIIEAMNTCRIA